MTFIRKLIETHRKADPLNRSVAMALRTALVTGIPLLLFVFSVIDRNTTLWASIAALYVAFSDVGGVYRRRVLALFGTLVLTTLMAFFGAVITHTHWLLPIAMFLVAFLCSYLILWGESATSVGVWTLFAFITSAGIPADFDGAVSRAEIWFFGGFLALTLSLIVLSIRPQRIVETTQKRLYSTLAKYIQETVQTDHKSHRQELLNLQTDIAGLMGQLQMQHGGLGQSEGAYFYVHQRFSSLLAIALEIDDQRNRRRHLQACLAVGKQLDSLAVAIGAALSTIVDGRLSTRDIDEALENAVAIAESEARKHVNHKQQFEELLVSAVELEYLEQMVSELHSIAHDLSAGNKHLPVIAQPPSLKTLILPGLDNLRTGSFAFRHASRVAVATTLSAIIFTWFIPDTQGIGRYLQENHYWMTLTIVVIMMPHYAQLFRRLGERVLGTLAGSLIALVIIWWVKTPEVLALILVPLGALAFYFFKVRYWVFVFFITLWVLLLLNIGAPGHEDVAIARVLNTLVGAFIAYMVGTFVLPSREGRTIRDEFCDALEANRLYLQSIDVTGPTRERAEDARVAMVNMLAGVGRLCAEPGNRREELSFYQSFGFACEDLSAALGGLARHSDPEKFPVAHWQRQLHDLELALQEGYLRQLKPMGLQRQDLQPLHQQLLNDRAGELKRDVVYRTQRRETLISVDAAIQLNNRIECNMRLLERAVSHIVTPSMERAPDSALSDG